MVVTAYLALIATLIFIFKFTVPIFPGYLKLELSDTIGLFVALILPFYNVILFLVTKFLLSFLVSITGINVVGFFADFLSSFTFIGIFVFLIFIFKISFYRYHSNLVKKTTWSSLILSDSYIFLSLLLAIVFEAIILSICNQLFLLKLYGLTLPASVIYSVFIPFNLLKFSLNFVVYILIFIPLANILYKARLI